MAGLFQLRSDFRPSGDQPEAIARLIANLRRGQKHQTLEGITGSGKTFTLANVIAAFDRPVLVLSHNKTLAAQLYSEFKDFFPQNAVEYFVSYYDYYLPESYIPQTDTYIAKDASINENIEKLRLSATASLLERRDTIVVSSVSCIYGLGSPDDYANMCVTVVKDQAFNRDLLLEKLVAIQYLRNDVAPEKGQFRVRGDLVEVCEPQRDDCIRLSFWGDTVESIERRDMVTGKIKSRPDSITFYPCKHFVLPQERIEAAVGRIQQETDERVAFFERENLLVEAQRLRQRVDYDIEMMREIGYCSGIENYSMHLAQRKPGSRPSCLLDFFDRDFLLLVDESHVTLPQVQAMYKADRNRKQVLIDHGFRLPSALDNRPLMFSEFEALSGDTIYVSATPGEYELAKSEGEVIEQLIRPTGLPDPKIEVRPLENQVDDVIEVIRSATARHERVLVTTLTKKNAERLSEYLGEVGIKASYLHSDMDALERVRVLAKLRAGDFNCLIGINLLREGIDLPEVAVVAILDADKEGFLRSERSLVQVAGRAARNASGRVVLYAEHITDSMQALMDKTAQHREKQLAFNQAHHITPKTVVNRRKLSISEVVDLAGKKTADIPKTRFEGELVSEQELDALAEELTREMLHAAENLEFERAAALRDRLKKMKKI
ncbi:MAG: excinuclease ABC subunit UvrB [Victivallaceae bacterium]|nr:excinuclease ABC subunit UvrB [Victivallaceae bacterium]